MSSVASEAMDWSPAAFYYLRDTGWFSPNEASKQQHMEAPGHAGLKNGDEWVPSPTVTQVKKKSLFKSFMASEQVHMTLRSLFSTFSSTQSLW